MVENICGIGLSKSRFRPLETEVQMQLNRGVEHFGDAYEGLNGAKNKEYPLILLSDKVEADKLDLPEDRLISPDDPVGIGCIVTERLRESKLHRITPIIVVYYPEFDGYTAKEAIKKYEEAGVTDFFEKGLGSDRKDFIQLLKKHLETKK